MKILLIHKYNRLIGGPEKYFLDLSKLLQKKGHKVAKFSMKHPENLKSQWSKYFVDYIDLRKLNLRNVIRISERMIYSYEAKKKINQLLDEFRPDIVHINNIYFHLSPSIIPEIKKRNIPIVYTVHDYHLLTPNVTFFHEGKICEKTKGGKYYKAIFHKCVEGSYLASFVPSIALHFHKILNVYKGVDTFIAPSKFMKKKLLENNYEDKRIKFLPNFLNMKDYQTTKTNMKEKYILYFGRFLEHKGVKMLPKLAEKLPEVNFKLVGDGPLEKYLKAKARDTENIEIINFQKPDKLKKIISKSYFVIVPSIWYENMPYSISESFALGKPVIASRIGGIPELVKEGKNGLLFSPNDLSDCQKKVRDLWNDSGLVKDMGAKASELIRKKFNSDRHYMGLKKIYHELID